MIKKRSEKTLFLIFALLLAFVPFINAEEPQNVMSTCQTRYWYDVYNQLAEPLRQYSILVGTRINGSDIISCSGYFGRQEMPIKNFPETIYFNLDNCTYDPMKKGKNNDIFFLKAGGHYFGAWCGGIPIWQDQPGGKTGIYDKDIDVVIYEGYAPPFGAPLQDGNKGFSDGSIYYFDNNSNNIWDTDEEVWLDSVYHTTLSYLAVKLENVIFNLCEKYYIDADFQGGDLSGIEHENIPFLLQRDAQGNYAQNSRIKLFPERSGEDAYRFTLIPSLLPDGTQITDTPVYARYDYHSNLPEPLFPVFFDEVRQLLNRNLFKSVWIPSEYGSSWDSDGENNYKHGSSVENESQAAAYSNAMINYENSAAVRENIGPCAHVDFSHRSAPDDEDEYDCHIYRRYSYLKLPSWLGNFNILPFSADFYAYASSYSIDKFNSNGDSVLENRWSRFAQQAQGTDINIKKKLGSLILPSYTSGDIGDDERIREGYGVALTAFVLKWDFQNLNIPQFDLSIDPATDTNRDDLIDVGIDLKDIRNETGTIVHLPEMDDPQVMLPLRWDTAYNNTLQCCEYLSQGGIAEQRINPYKNFTPIFPYQPYISIVSPKMQAMDIFMYRSSLTCLFNDVFIDDAEKNIHVKRIGLIRPRGQVVIFDFPWDSENSKFEDIGVPTGIHSNRTYRLLLRLHPEGYGTDRYYYSLHFDSGIVYEFYPHRYHYIEENRLQFVWYVTKERRKNALTTWRKIDETRYHQEYSYETVHGFKYDIKYEWNSSGRLGKLFYKTKDASETIEVNLEYDDNGKIIKLKKKVPASLAVNGETEYEISISGDTITYPDGSTSTRVQTAPAGSARTVTITGTMPDSGTAVTEYEYDSSDLLTKLEIRAGGDTKTVNYAYYTGEDVYPNTAKKKHKLKSATYPDGSWAFYEYNDNGWLSKEYSPFMSAPAVPSSAGGGRVTEYLYSSHEERDSVDEKNIWEFPRTVISFVNGIETARSYFSAYHYIPSWPGQGESVRKICANNAAVWEDASNLVFQARFSHQYYREDGAFVHSSYTPTEKKSRIWSENDLKTYGELLNAEIINGDIKGYRTDIRNSFRIYSQDPVSLRTVETITNPRGIVYSYKVTDSASGQVIQLAKSATDSFGRITRTDYLDGSHEEFNNYCLFGPQEIIDRNGCAISYEYYPNGLVKRVSDSVKIVEYSYDALGNVSGIKTTPISGGGEVISESYTYDAIGRITSRTDAIGTTTYQRTTDNGLLTTTTTFPDGTSILLDRYMDGATASISGSAACPVSYDYGVDATKGRWTKTTRDGVVSQTFYNMLGNTHRLEVSSGHWTETVFDSKGRPVSTADSSGRQRNIVYNSKNEISQTTEDGVVTDYSYSVTDGRHVNTSTLHSDLGDIVTVNETTLDGLTSSTTVNGRTTSSVMERLGAGMIKTVTTDHLGRVTENIVSPSSSRTELRSGGTAIASVQNDLDGHSRVKDSVFSRTGADILTYRPGTSQIEQYTASDGKNTSLSYQPGNYNPVSVRTPENLTLAPRFNTRGQLEGFGGAADGVFDAFTSYDDQGRPALLETTGAPGTADTVWNYSTSTGLPAEKQIEGISAYNIDYYPDGRLNTLSKNGIGIKTFNYTNAPKLFPAGFSYSDGVTPDVTISGHNDFGRPGQITTNGVSEHTFTYNSDAQITGVDFSSPLMSPASFTYAYNNLLRTGGTLAGNAVSYQYDSAGRLKTISSGDIEAEYAYVPDSVNLIASVTIKKSGTVVLTRDITWSSNADRVSSVTNRSNGTFAFSNSYGVSPLSSSGTLANGTLAFNYEYLPGTDKVGKVTLSDGSAWEYQYDDRGQLLGALCRRGAFLVPGYEFAYQSDSITNVLSGGRVRFGGVPEFETEPDIFNSIKIRRVGDTLEVSGSAKKEAAVSVNNELLERYDSEEFFAILNANNAASAVFLPINVTAVLFDPEAVPEIGGNRPGNVSGADIVATVTGSVYMPQNPETPVYDAAGRLLDNSLYRYSWNSDDRLVGITSNAGIPACSLEFSYDYAGRRVLKEVYEGGGNLTGKRYFYYDSVLLNGAPADFGVITGEKVLDASGNAIVEKQYLQGLDLNGGYQSLGGVGGLCAVIETASGVSKSYFPLIDARGNIHGYVDENKKVVARYSYDPYGRILSYSGEKAKDFNFLFHGKYYDWETGLYDFGLRWFDPSTCKWLSRDPIQETGGLNLYALTNGDPINGVEYLGCESWWWEDLWTGVNNPLAVGGAALEGAKTFLPYTDYDGRLTLGGPVWDEVSDTVFQPDVKINRAYDVTSDYLRYGMDPYYSVKTGYSTWKYGSRGSIVLNYFDEERKWQSKTLSPSQFTNSSANRVFINGILNDETNALILGRSHTNKNINGEIQRKPFILIHNPTFGFVEDVTECALEKVVGPSNVSRQIASLLAPRARANMSMEFILHSQGILIGDSSLRVLRNNYGINNWSNLEVEFHGSPVNRYIGMYDVWKTGAKWGGMKNNPGDFVGNVLGFNTTNPFIGFYSIIKIPSLGFDVNKYPSGYLHSEHTIYFNE